MDIKKILIIAVVALLAIAGFNYYNSSQNKESIAARTAETESLRANLAKIEAEKAANNHADIISDVGVVESSNADNKVTPETAVEVVSDDKLSNKPDDSVCESLIEMSESIMRNRLNGVSITNSLEAVNSIKDGTAANDAVSNLAKQIVIEAYESPSYSTDSYKDDAIREFGASQYLACVKAIG